MNKNESQAQTVNGQVQIFENAQFGQIRTAGTSDEPLFCLADICRALELQTQNTKNRLKQKGVYSINTLTQGGEQQLLYINEQNLYRLIMRSDKPQAEPFQDWVCGEVLPSIRKNGGYIATQDTDTPEVIMARALQVAQRTIENHKLRLQMAQSQIDEQKHQIESLSPLADYTRDVLQSDSTYTLTQIAKDLGYTSVHKFIDVLSANKILYKQSCQWMPTSKFAGSGYFRTRTAKFFHSDGSIGTSISTVITEKGRAFLHNRFRKEVNNE